MTLIALVTGASSGFGQMIARDFAAAGHTVYASMRDTGGRNTERVRDNDAVARSRGIDLRSVELDVQDEASVDAAVASILREHGRIDVVVHNAGHMVSGLSEAFTPGQLAQAHDINVLGTQRLTRAPTGCRSLS